MNPTEFHEWLKKTTVKELVDHSIWESVMAGTAHCGWTDRAREGLVKHIQDAVDWALVYHEVIPATPAPEKGEK